MAPSDDALHVVFMLVVFAIGAFVMRSAGVIINDITDRKLDAQVARTRSRPLATGEVTLTQAYTLLSILLLCGVLLLFTLNIPTIILGFIIVIPIILYPFMKRWIAWPQLFLGVTFNWGVLMAWTAVTGAIALAPIVMYLACVFWTMGFDTIYGFQDIEDDKKAGMKSLPITLGKKAKRYISVFYLMVILLLTVAGILADMGIVYMLFLISGFALLFWQIVMVDLSNPKDCGDKFKANNWFGMIVFAGIVFDKFL